MCIRDNNDANGDDDDGGDDDGDVLVLMLGLATAACPWPARKEPPMRRFGARLGKKSPAALKQELLSFRYCLIYTIDWAFAGF